MSTVGTAGKAARVGQRVAWTAVVVSLLVLPSLADAATARLRVQGRFRDAPGIHSNVLEFLPAGTSVEVLEVLPNQWRRVQLADGRTGYVWKEHFVLEDEAGDEVDDQNVALVEPTADAEAAPPAENPAAEPGQESPPPAPAMPASIEDVQALREEVRRLAATQQDILARLEAMTPQTPTSPLAGPISGTPIDGTAGAAALFMLVGAVVFWVLSRILRRRRDRRPKIRL